MIAASQTSHVTVSTIQSKKHCVIRLTRQSAFDSKTADQYSHESLVSHWVDDTSNYSLQFPSSRDPTVDKVGDTGICEEADSPCMIVVEYKIAYYWRSEQPREGEKIGDGIDVFMWGQIRQSLYDLLAQSS